MSIISGIDSFGISCLCVFGFHHQLWIQADADEHADAMPSPQELLNRVVLKGKGTSKLDPALAQAARALQGAAAAAANKGDEKDSEDEDEAEAAAGVKRSLSRARVSHDDDANQSIYNLNIFSHHVFPRMLMDFLMMHQNV